MTDVLKLLEKGDLNAQATVEDSLDGYRDQRPGNRISAQSAYVLRLEDHYLRDTYPERRK